MAYREEIFGRYMRLTSLIDQMIAERKDKNSNYFITEQNKLLSDANAQIEVLTKLDEQFGHPPEEIIDNTYVRIVKLIDQTIAEKKELAHEYFRTEQKKLLSDANAQIEVLTKLKEHL